jgi:hypothetical protein
MGNGEQAVGSGFVCYPEFLRVTGIFFPVIPNGERDLNAMA